MKFRARITKVWNLATSNTWIMDVKILSGDIRNQCRASVSIGGKEIKILIKHVGFVDRPLAPEKKTEEISFTIEKPDCDPATLEGKELLSWE